MDLATVIGLVFGIVIIVVVLIMDGGSPLELFAHPSAIILIFGGSLAATTITVPLKIILLLPKLIIKSATTQNIQLEESIGLIIKMADQARREGLLSLEEAAKKIDDPFLKKGIMMVIDGVDATQIRAILETNIEQLRVRHRKNYSIFSAAGGFSPTFGIIGTVMGLISVLKQLDDPNKLAKSIAGAFLATLWGLLSANLIFLPLAAKLKVKSDEEAHIRQIQLEGILAIHAGENPRIVREKLLAFLSPAETRAMAEDVEGPAAQKSSTRTAGAEKARA